MSEQTTEPSMSDVEYANPEDFTEQEKTDWDGKKVKVASVKIRKKQSPFAESGDKLPKGPDGKQLTREVQVITIRTVPLKNNAFGEPVAIEEDVNIKWNKVTNKPVVSMHPKSKAKKICAKYNVNRLEDLSEVLLSKRVRTTGTTYLGINTG